MARLTKLTVSGYRSIRDQISIIFPDKKPVVLIGENNAGKSNIVRALDWILGEMWPGSREPEDHDFWKRSPTDGRIEIRAEIDGLSRDKYNNPAGGFQWLYDNKAQEKPVFCPIGKAKYPSNEMRNQYTCIVIGADRRLAYQLSYTTKWTLLSKLMRKFHTSLVQDETRVKRLKASFESVKAIFNEVLEFAGFQNELKDQFADMFAGMSYGLHVDFSAYDPSNFFHSLRVQPEEDGAIRTFEELGTGQEQLLALAFAHAYAKAFFGGILLVIEEPEAHLHPLAQQWLAKRIFQMARDGLQIVLETHSPAFVNILGLEGLVLVRKIEGATNVKQISSEDLCKYCIDKGADSVKASPDTILPFYAGSVTQEILSGLFAKKVVLVEGSTESLALPVYLNKIDLDVTKEGIAIVPVMGKGNLAKWWRFYTAFDIPTFLTFDNDDKDDEKGVRRKDALKSMGISDDDMAGFVGRADWYISDTVCIFGKDFEATMRSSFSEYVQLEKEVQVTTGDSKPLTARSVAERINLNSYDPGWIKLKDLSSKLKSLTAPTLNENIPF